MRTKSNHDPENAPAFDRAPPIEFGSVPVSSTALASSNWSFDGVIRRVLGFSRAAKIAGKGRRERVGAQRPSFDALRLFVRTLDAPTRDKLRTVMRAGRDARTLTDARSSLVDERRDPNHEAHELFIDETASLQHLQRGHAIACATSFDLELELANWASSGERPSLDERVWLRFGRELALSDSAEWSCLARVDAQGRLEALYLRRGDHRWWSFDSVVDRPSVSEIARCRVTHAKRRKLVSLPLDAVVGRRCRTDKGAVRRAALAMSARLGYCRMPLSNATAGSD